MQTEPRTYLAWNPKSTAARFPITVADIHLNVEMKQPRELANMTVDF